MSKHITPGETPPVPAFFCAVRGLPAPRRMCLSVGCSSDDAGRKRCHSDKPCEHKTPDQPSTEKAPA